MLAVNESKWRFGRRGGVRWHDVRQVWGEVRWDKVSQETSKYVGELSWFLQTPGTNACCSL